MGPVLRPAPRSDLSHLLKSHKEPGLKNQPAGVPSGDESDAVPLLTDSSRGVDAVPLLTDSSRGVVAVEATTGVDDPQPMSVAACNWKKSPALEEIKGRALHKLPGWAG